jgi:phospholipid/cholesterol/gamma-HCH transport system ATP-binding protein
VDFGANPVLRDINLEVPRGQTLAIIGESGCGKTVLLKTVIGLVQPTSGEVIFDGNNLAQLDEKQLTQQRIRFGFVFQNAALFDSLTVGQNVAFPLRQHRHHRAEELREIVLAHLAEVGLPDSVVAKKPAELSGGMRKRVGLARALVMNPELMLYDEPTTGLDPIMSDVINELMLRTRQQHEVTSIIVTHDMRTAQKVADRVVMISPLARLASNESQVLFDGTPDELSNCPDPRVLQFVRGEARERLMEMGEVQN